MTGLSRSWSQAAYKSEVKWQDETVNKVKLAVLDAYQAWDQLRLLDFGISGFCNPDMHEFLAYSQLVTSCLFWCLVIHDIREFYYAQNNAQSYLEAIEVCS